MILTEENCPSLTVRRCVQVAIFELSQSQVYEQIPSSQPKRFGTLILPDLCRSAAHHSLGKTKMITSEETNRFGIVLSFQEKIGRGIANRGRGVLSSERSRRGRGPDEDNYE
jgi:phage gp36-like protein